MLTIENVKQKVRYNSKVASEFNKEGQNYILTNISEFNLAELEDLKTKELSYTHIKNIELV